MNVLFLQDLEGNFDAFSYKINFFDEIDGIDENLVASHFRIDFDVNDIAPAGAALRFELYGYEGEEYG